MSGLRDIQDAVQAAILGTGRSTAEDLLALPPRGDPHSRLNVYRKAYLLRLQEFLANDYEMLRLYLGEPCFADVARDYAVAHPSDTRNARWYSRHLPAFLKSLPRFAEFPEVAELAMFEQALNDVFDAVDAAPLTLADLAAVTPEDIGSFTFRLIPASRILSLSSNAVSIWSALRVGDVPPPAEPLASRQTILVWRQGGSSRFRILGDEELMAITCIAQGMDFARVCEMIAMYDGAEDAALRAASYLRGWSEAELLVPCMTDPSERRRS